MYLHETLKDMEGKEYPMVGIFPETFYTGKLSRFGYVTLTEGTVFGERQIRSLRMNFTILTLQTVETIFSQ